MSRKNMTINFLAHKVLFVIYFHMAEYYLSLPGGLKARFKTACDLRENDESRLYLAAHVPGVRFLDEKPDSFDFSLNHEFAEKTRLVSKGNDITFFTPTADEFARDICHLLYAVTRRELLKNELYPVHAACVGQDDSYVLIVGHSGAGKSTLAHDLVAEDDWKLFSGNKTVTSFEDGAIRAIAGTSTMTVLDDKLKRQSYEMDPECYAEDPEVTIEAVHIVRVNDGVEETQKLARSTGIRALHPFFLDVVNADVIVGDYHVFNGATSSKIKHHLNRQLRQSLKAVPVYKSSGSMDFLTQRVLEV